MVPQTQSLIATHLIPSLIAFPSNNSSRPTLSNTVKKTIFSHLSAIPHRKPLLRAPKCAVSVVSEPTKLESSHNYRPFPAEISRTIMEVSSVGTLSTLTQEGSPLGIGVHFIVDSEGTPVLCLNSSFCNFSTNSSSSLHVQLEQCGLRTSQCTIQGSLSKPVEKMALKKLNSVWKKSFGEEMDEDLMYVVAVERILQIDDFMEDGVWISSLDYKVANPDPLRDVAEKIVNEINAHNLEDVYRFCSVFCDLDIQVKEAKMVWVDRLGFDLRLCSPQNDVVEVRLPFAREVTDEKGAKSSFNGMSQLAWEVEKNYQAPEFEKVEQWKKIKYRVRNCI